MSITSSLAAIFHEYGPLRTGQLRVARISGRDDVRIFGTRTWYHRRNPNVSSESTAGAYDLADALVDGDRAGALRLAEALRASEDRPGRLVFPVVRRLREVHRAAGLVEGGASERQVAKAIGLSPYAAKRTMGRARGADRDALERALCAFADLEVDTRAGGGVDEDTAFSVALANAAG